MSMVIKGMIRITNEDRQLLSSLAILIIPLTARLIKEIPGLVCKPIVPTNLNESIQSKFMSSIFDIGVRGGGGGGGLQPP